MTAHAPMARVPFAPLDNPRLQHLASAKNRQNGIVAQKSVFGKVNVSSAPTKVSPKRPLEVHTFDDYDGENIDPAVFTFPSKKSKGDVKPFGFSLTPSTSMPPPPVPSRLSTPIRANMSTPRTPLTAPAGRSPKRKIASISKSRRTSAPFTRVDPPFMASRGASLPFSLDAALNGTFGKPTASPSASAGSTIQESMPKSWFFEIYEDTPEEEAANLMEHSTLTLDLSSDDEDSKRTKDDRGKENVAPEGYEAAVASRAVDAVIEIVRPAIKRAEIVRRKVASDAMDDGERSPLSDLETDPFFPEGLDKDSHVVVDLPTPEKVVEKPAAKVDVTPAKPIISPSPIDMPASSSNGDITIFEDSSSPVVDDTTTTAPIDHAKTGKALAVHDENTAPSVDV